MFSLSKINPTIKIYKSRIQNDKSNTTAGTIIDCLKDGIAVKTGDGAIVIEELKIEGKKKMTAKEYLNGIKKEELINKKFEKE